jgi:[FeFe] hydrogenase H-cluster maturation GTPase HydF
MGMNEVPSAERVHIGFFGVRNAGKSSIVNAVTGQEMALVSDVKGTTTDPVRKAMELLPVGPVVIIDTPGIDDEGSLGRERVRKARQVLRAVDVAVLVTDAARGLQEADRELLDLFHSLQIPCLIVRNKADLLQENAVSAETHTEHNTENKTEKLAGEGTDVPSILVSARTGMNIYELKEAIAKIACPKEPSRPLVADLLSPGDVAVLVVPIDSAAPKGRLILPQQQTIRDALEAGASVMVTRESELAITLQSLAAPPRIVITDSQAFGVVSQIVPKDVLLTSFSILMARYKGNLEAAIRGAARLDHLKDGDTVLIAEGCTHHRQCDDIGTVKMPRWLRAYTGADLQFAFCSGGDFPEDLSPYSLIIHCGGCMLNEREMRFRTAAAAQADRAMTNYGTAIAQMHGILKRSLSPFPRIQSLL